MIQIVTKLTTLSVHPAKSQISLGISLRCPLVGSYDHNLALKRKAKIRLNGCTGLSEPSLSSQAIMFILPKCEI